MGPDLPNATSCQQEMEDWFQDLNRRSSTQAQEIFEEKTYQYALSVKNCQDDGETKIKTATLTNDYHPQIINDLSNEPI